MISIVSALLEYSGFSIIRTPIIRTLDYKKVTVLLEYFSIGVCSITVLLEYLNSVLHINQWASVIRTNSLIWTLLPNFRNKGVQIIENPLYLNFCTKLKLVDLPQPLHTLQFITVRYIFNCCLLFTHWSTVLQYNVNDSQFVFYLHGPASPREELKGSKAPLPPQNRLWWKYAKEQQFWRKGPCYLIQYH